MKPSNSSASRSFGSKRRSLAPKKVTVAYLNSKLEFVPNLSEEAQRAVLELREQVEIHNQQVEEIRDFNSKTFNKPSPEDMQSLENNLVRAFAMMLERNRIIIDLCMKVAL